MVDALYPIELESKTQYKKTAISGETSNQPDVQWVDEIAIRDEILEAVYIQSCYCSFGATLEAESRPIFDEYMKKASGLMIVEDTVEKPASLRNYHLITHVFYSAHIAVHLL